MERLPLEHELLNQGDISISCCRTKRRRERRRRRRGHDMQRAL